MAKFRSSLCICVLMAFFFIYFMWPNVAIFRKSWFRYLPKCRHNKQMTRQEEAPIKKFMLYLVQCKDCLSDYYMKPQVLGSSKNHDILVLSYKDTCKKAHPSHITYITAPFPTTWTTGRNYLYRYASNNLSVSYLYYSFIDEDLKLENSERYLRESHKKLDKHGEALLLQPESPWRKFENFLIDYQPAIGVVDNLNNFRLIFKPRADIIPTYVFPGMGVDAMFNAFHRDVIHDMLPYDESFDNKTWWFSQQVTQCRLFFRFHAHTVTFMPVIAVNAVHQKYPRGLMPLQDACKEEFEMLPNFIKNSSLTNEIRKYTIYQSVSYFRYVAPPKFPIGGKYCYFADDFQN